MHESTGKQRCSSAFPFAMAGQFTHAEIHIQTFLYALRITHTHYAQGLSAYAWAWMGSAASLHVSTCPDHARSALPRRAEIKRLQYPNSDSPWIQFARSHHALQQYELPATFQCCRAKVTCKGATTAQMSTSSTVAGSTVCRLLLITSRFQARAISRSKSEDETFERECWALAARLNKERGIWEKLGNSQAAWSPARVDAVVLLVSACLHVRDAARPFLDGPGKLRLLDAAAYWFSESLWAMCNLKLPASQRQAVADAVLRGRILQGCSRQLASLADILAPKSNIQDMPSAQLPHSSLETLRPACTFVQCLGQLVFALCHVHLFSTPRPGLQKDISSGEQEAVRTYAEGVVGQQDRGAQRTQHGAEDGGREQGGTGQQGIQQQQQARGAAGTEAAPEVERRCLQQARGAAGTEVAPEVERPRDLLQEMLTGNSSSGVLEHLSRCVLLLAGALQGVGPSGSGHGHGEQGTNRSSGQQQQQQQQQQQCRCDYNDHIVYNAEQAYKGLSVLTKRPGLLDGDGCCCPAGGGPDRPGSGHHALTSADEYDTALLGALDTFQGPAEVSLIRRALSGPCTRHLVLCAGLNALRALDGGSTYGMPEGAGLQLLMPVFPSTRPEQGGQQQLDADALLNLLTLLAMRSCDPDAEPPGRAMRLRLTLRVVRAAVAAAAAAADASRSGPSPGEPHYFLKRGDAAMVAVQALHFALRHMPPPPPAGDREYKGGGGGGRRFQALRRWAALAEEVACKAAPTRGGGVWSGDAGRRLGLLLSLDTGVVRPETAGGGCGSHLCMCRVCDGVVGRRLGPTTCLAGIPRSRRGVVRGAWLWVKPAPACARVARVHRCAGCMSG